MKKSLLLISIITCIVYSSYGQNLQKNPEYNEQQTHFIEFMQSLHHEYNDRPNNLDLNRFNNKMNEYLYFFQPVIGWKGIISNIKILDSRVLSYSMNFEFGEFNCTFISFFSYETEKELRDYYLYNKLINLREGSTVYFDGHFLPSMQIGIKNYQSDDVFKYLHPIYNLEVFEIYTSQPDTLSPQLIEQLSSSYQRFLIYIKKHFEQITDLEFEEALSVLPEIKKDSLSDDEIEYLNRYLKELAPLLFNDIISNP